jgi:nucleotide-binding universal stress UspA family protein
MCRRLVFGINQPEVSWAAFLWSCANLIRSNDSITFVHVIENNKKGESAVTNTTNDMTRYENYCRRFGLKYETVIAKGTPAAFIAGITIECDLCILGSSRTRSFVSSLTGCFASDVSKICDCPILIVKEPKVLHKTT